MNTRFLNTCLCAATLIPLALSGTAFAQSNAALQIGKRPPVVSATAASGRWLERAPLDPVMYGKSRGICPANSSDAKIILYTNILNDDFFKIAAAVDKYIANRPDLAWSFVEVRDTKGAQYGGYTVEELRTRLNEIQALVKKHGIQHLSFLVAAPGTGTTTPDPTVTLAHVRPGERAHVFPTVDWVTTMPAPSLQGDTLAKQLSSLDAAITPKKAGA